MNLKEKVIKQLEQSHPLLAEIFSKCTLEYDDEQIQKERHPTIQISSNSSYYLEQMQSRSVWPKVHEAVMEVIGKDFTLDFRPLLQGKSQASNND